MTSFSALQSALLGLSVSVSSLPTSSGPDAALGRYAETATSSAVIEVTGETKRDESLRVDREEYADLFHVEDLPALENLEARAEKFLVGHPESLSEGAEDQVEIRVTRRTQTMTVLLNGKEKWDGWKVSTGADKFETPAGSFPPTELAARYYSRNLGVVLPYAIRFSGGYLIHAAGPTGETYLGERRSHGSVRLNAASAKLLYSLVEQVGISHVKITVK